MGKPRGLGRGVERRLAPVFLAAGLTVLVGLPLAGLHPAWSDWESGPTATFVGAAGCVVLGVLLFIRVGRADRLLLARIEKVVSFQEECRNLQAQTRRAHAEELASLRDSVNAWMDATHQWFSVNLPLYAETCRRPDRETHGGAHISHFGEADELVRALGVYRENLSDIVVSLMQEWTRA
jgi:hypothetical protein